MTKPQGHRPAVRVVLPTCLVLAIGGTACGGGVRPYLTPLPNAWVDTIPTAPDAVIRQLITAVTGQGMRIQLASPAEGYLETDWYDVVSQTPGGEYASDPHRVVRLRFFADPIAPDETRLVSEAVYRRSIDPSLPERQNELMVPPGHAGEVLLRLVLSAVGARGEHS